MTTRFLLVVATALGLCARSLQAADWPQFRGPQRDGISSEAGLLKSWPEAGPPLVWTYSEAGVGYSGPAVVANRIYLAGARGDSEFVFALDARNGNQIWATKLGGLFAWKGNSWNEGPSATPTVDGDLVYSLSGNGDLVCVEAATGTERWRKSMAKDLGGDVNPMGGGPEGIGWGYTWSALVDGDSLICVPGGNGGLLAALDKRTGAVKWRSKEVAEAATYSSPVVADIEGVRQYIEMTYQGVVGVAAKDGSLLWYHKRKPAYPDVVIPTPIYKDGHVFTAAGFGAGCDLIKVAKAGDKFQTTSVYSKRELVNDNGGFVVVNGNVFGYSNKGKGWTCLDFKSGKVLWSDRRSLGSGSVIAAEGNLYCYGEDEGIVALVEAGNKPWVQKGRFEIPKKSTMNKPNGKLWTHPVIANGKLYLRDQNLLFCYNVKP